MKKKILVLLSLLLVLPALAPVLAQDTSMNSGFDEKKLTTDKAQRPERKQPGYFFHRPAETNSAAQLAYADGLVKKDKLSKAISEYSALVHEWHDSIEAPKAQFALAELLEKTGKSEAAFDEFQYLISFFPGHFKYDEVLDRQYRIANEVMTAKRYHWILFKGASTPERALPLFEKIIENGKHWDKAPEIMYNIGVINETAGDRMAAVSAYEELQGRYPGNRFAEDAAVRRANCLCALANENPRDEAGCRDALSALSMCIRDFPKNANVEEAARNLETLKERLADMHYERAMYYDKIVMRPQSAVIMYSAFIRSFPTSRRVMEVTERIDVLKSKMEKQNEK